MVTPDSAVRRLMRETGKLLQPYGFHGSGTTWTRVAPGGVASVGHTRVLRSWTGGQQLIRFRLFLDATPIAWWEWENWRRAQLGHPATPLEQAEGPRLISDAGLPNDLTQLWSVRQDPTHLQADIDTVRAELPRRVHSYARRALQLLEPDRYLDELLAEPDPKIGTWTAIAILLTDRGPGPQLDNALEQLHAHAAREGRSDHSDTVITYTQTRTASV